jgi:transposase
MRADFKTFVGVDVHKDSIAIAYADADFTQAPRFVGTTGYSVISLTKALAKLGKPGELSVCHEAGPCGFGLVRSLGERGYATEVIAPSRVPRRPADRIKTDRRDALLLARLHRSGERSVSCAARALPLTNILLILYVGRYRS